MNRFIKTTSGYTFAEPFAQNDSFKLKHTWLNAIKELLIYEELTGKISKRQYNECIKSLNNRVEQLSNQ